MPLSKLLRASNNLRRMLLDLLEYAVTPCSWHARALGFLKSSLQVQARYRRCRRAWEPHLARTRQLILEAARACPQQRTALVLGAGLLHDIPLRELAGLFRSVVLVDVVFPWASRIRCARFPNVRRVAADITGTAERLAHASSDVELPISKPVLFLDEPTLDLTVSVNLLSQLPFIPTRYLEARWARGGELSAAQHATLEKWSRHLQEAHLEYLAQLPGRVALITDTGGFHRDRSGRVVKEWDNLHGLALPSGGERWEWDLAPAPEADPVLDHVVRVAAFSEWKRNAARADAS